MKSITELRTILKFKPENINSRVDFLAEHCKIDFDVFLPTRGINLQRDFVWNIDQKREIIWSILMNRHIPRMAILNVLDDDSIDGIYQVIDGKQRLSSILGFYRGEFTLLIDGKEYYYNELPKDYQRVIKGYQMPYNIVNEVYKGDMSDQDKIDWFTYINFAGTPQDQEHFEKLKN